LARAAAEDEERTRRRAPADGSARGWGETAKGGRKENGRGDPNPGDTGAGQGRARAPSLSVSSSSSWSALPLAEEGNKREREAGERGRVEVRWWTLPAFVFFLCSP
jgi:hypothetical protein